MYYSLFSSALENILTLKLMFFGKQDIPLKTFNHPPQTFKLWQVLTDRHNSRLGPKQIPQTNQGTLWHFISFTNSMFSSTENHYCSIRAKMTFRHQMTYTKGIKVNTKRTAQLFCFLDLMCYIKIIWDYSHPFENFPLTPLD